MARTRVMQNSLITGVIAPTLLGRIDLEKYYNAVEEAENVVIMPHGGMERRSGLKLLTEVPIGSRLFSFEFSNTQNYVMVFTTTNFTVYLPDSGAPLATIAWTTVLTTTQLQDMDIIQSADTVIITHEDFNPIQIQRQGSDISWAISNIVFENIPKFDYDKTKVPDYFNYGSSLTFDIVVDEILYNNDGNNVNGLNEFLYKCKVARPSIDISTEDFNNLTNWESLGVRPNVWGITNPTKDYDDTATQDLIINTIVYKISDTHYYRSKLARLAIDLTIEDFTNTTNWEDLGAKSTTNYGWIRTCTFHQGRLWFGGSKSKPTSVWGSVVNDFFNFDTGKDNVLADSAMFDVLDTDQFNAITNIISARNLQVLTSGGEFVNMEDILTPSTSSWVRYTGYGAKRVKPATLDGSTYFMDRFGKTVRGLIYNFNDGGYTSPPVSILSEHLINSVVDLDIVRGSSISVANLLYLVNGDGTVAVFNTMRDENISGWTKWSTNGLFKKVTVTVDTVTFIIERDGKEYLEILDRSVLLDHAIKDVSSNRVEVDDVLFNNEIRVVADEITQTSIAAVDESGIYYAYADRQADIIYAGLNYTVKIKTLPVAVSTQSEGNIVNLPKRVTKCTLNLYNSRGIYINGRLVTARKFGTPTDSVFAPVTGIESTYLLGYNNKTQVTISQNDPDPMTVLAIDLEISY